MGWSTRLRIFCLCVLAGISTDVLASANIRFTSLSAGEELTCGVAANANLYCWGKDEYILVEKNRSIDLPVPTVIAPELRFQSVSVGDSILCGIATSGHAYCWGQALADTKPVLISEDLNFRSISSGYHSACAVTTGDAVYCWEGNYSEKNKPVPVRIQTSTSFDSVLSSRSYEVACGIAKNGEGYCWGQVLGHTLGPSRTLPVRLKGTAPFQMISARRDGVLAIGRNGVAYLYPWNFNDYTSFQNFQNLSPVVLDFPIQSATIDARGAFVCAADRLGIGFCWGEDSFSGSGSKAKGDKPQQVSGNLKFSSMAVGHYHACGLTPEGAAYCWGGAGKLGNGLPGSWSIPTPVANPGAAPIGDQQVSSDSDTNREFSDERLTEKRLVATRELNSKRLVVMIQARSGEQVVGSGAGILFFAGLDRAYIITAYHLIRPEENRPLSISVTFWSKTNQPLEAKVTGDWDRSLDLLVLRVDGFDGLKLDLHTIPFGQVDREDLEKGDEVYHLGNPGGRTWGGNVMPDHFIEDRDGVAYFESSSIQPGVSGGALLDDEQQFIGMVRADDSGDGQVVLWNTIEGRLRDWGYPIYLGFAPPAPQFTAASVVGKLNFGLAQNHTLYSWPQVASTTEEPMHEVGGLKFNWIGSNADEWGLGLCGLADDGDAYCWGTVSTGPREDGYTRQPYQSAGRQAVPFTCCRRC